MTITGKLPRIIVDTLGKLGIVVDDIITGGDDIDVTIEDTSLMGTFIGNGKWEVTELDDVSNLFPELDEGDVISSDLFTKLLSNKINSSLILSFNPLGRVKYGIKEVGKNIADVGRKVADWATDKLYAEDAEKWIRGNGPYRRTFTDARDGKTRTKKDYNAGRVNVGKIESLGKMGHYKVLSGNPATQDFQVWHLYKNGNKIRCLDVKTGLKPQEAQWVYDNNIPNSWNEADWNPEGEIPEKASKIEVGETQEQKNQTEETTEENNVEDGVDSNESEKEESQTEEVPEDDNLDEWVKQYYSDKDKDVDILMNSLILSEEDNVTETKPKKKSKYNGCNVTGTVEADGTVVMASNVLEGINKPLISCSLILSKIEDFQNYIKKYSLQDKPKKVLTEILTRLVKIPTDDRNKMTKDSNNNVLLINFGNTDLTTENYIAQFEIYDDEVAAKVNLGKGNSLEGDDAIKMCTQTLDSIISQKQS